MPAEQVAQDTPLIPLSSSRDLLTDSVSSHSTKDQYSRLQQEEDNINFEPEEDYIWKQSSAGSRNGVNMSESHMAYPDAYYGQERAAQNQGPYAVNYDPSNNGHHGDGSVSPTSSQLSVIGENATLINRPTPLPKPQMKPAPPQKVMSARHIGPDGQPVEYATYGSGPAPPISADYMTYSYVPPGGDPSLDYGTYDPGRPLSPSSQAISQGYSNYGPYRAVSPNTTQNYEVYPPHSQQGYPGYEYQDYAPHPRPPSPPSLASESPQPHRAMPQVPRAEEPIYNHRPAGYDDMIDPAAMIPPRAEYPDRFGTYGYTGATVPVTSPGYTSYDSGAAPQGYLDRRPSYDDHPQMQVPHGRPPAPYPHPTRPIMEEGPPDEPPTESQYPPPRHPHLDSASVTAEDRDVRWRDPDLHEVVEFLSHPNNVVRANAAAYLQHLCYMDDNIKQKTRVLGGIPLLVELLNQEIPEIQRNAAGALRNLSFGRQNDENKRSIRNAGGLPALVRLLRKTPDNEIRELVTGILWNLSSCEELKRYIIDEALSVLVNHVLIPHSGWDRNRDPADQMKPHEMYWSTVFRNATGVLRNVSSAGEYARRKLRDCEGLVDSLFHLVRSAIGKNDMDNKSVENCVCILRNLSYRCQEVEDPDYDKKPVPPSAVPPRALVPIKEFGENLGCFGTSKKKKESQNMEKERREQTPSIAPNPRNTSEPAKGMELLWQPEVVHLYLPLLAECSNREILEAAAGAVQNLAACYWQPSIDIRAAMRKEKGLPVLVQLLQMDADRVVCAVATALRNLAMDHRNKELIGKYAMTDLVGKLPDGNPQNNSETSVDTIAAVLATLNEIIAKNSDFARSLLETDGVERLNYIIKQKGKFSPRVVKFTSQLLFNMWQHQELREAYRKAGWKESNFITRTLVARNSTSPPSSANNTLSRPISTQGGTNYEDRTLMRGRDLNSTGTPGSVPYSRSEELPLNEISNQPDGTAQPQLPRRPVGGVAVFPPPSMSPCPEPVYAQVNRERKKNRQADLSSQPLLLEDHSAGTPAGDSWV